MLPIVISAIENDEDRDLMTHFYLTYKALMYSEARKYLEIEEDVEDVVCEALTRIIDKMDVFRVLVHRQQIRYALTCVKNISYVLSKRRDIIKTVPFEDFDSDLFEDFTQTVETTVEMNLFTQYIRNIWHELDPDARMLMEQKYVLYWTDVELAEFWGIKPQSVRMRLTRTKRELMKQLQKNGFHLEDWLPDL